MLLYETQLLFEQQCHWTRWAHSLPKSFSPHSDACSSTMIGATSCHCSARKTISQAPETLLVSLIPGLSCSSPSTFAFTVLHSIEAPRSPAPNHLVLKPEVASLPLHQSYFCNQTQKRPSSLIFTILGYIDTFSFRTIFWHHILFSSHFQKGLQ